MWSYVYTCTTLLLYIGIRIRSEGLSQLMTKRNASEYIIEVYRDTHARYCRRRAKLRWACECRSSVAHSTKVGRLSWLSRRSVSCIRVALRAVSTRRLFAMLTPTHVMLTFEHSAQNNCIPKRDIIHRSIYIQTLARCDAELVASR